MGLVRQSRKRTRRSYPVWIFRISLLFLVSNALFVIKRLHPSGSAFDEDAQYIHYDFDAWRHPKEPSRPSVLYREDHFWLPGYDRPTKYRYPYATLEDNQFAVVAAVLSRAHTPQPRDHIRRTWAHNRSNVFFLIGGNWTVAVQDEFRQYQDLIWVDSPEEYTAQSNKILGLYAFANKHVKNLKYLIKADDDVFLRLQDLVEEILQNSSTPLYMGMPCTNKSKVGRDINAKWYTPKDLYAPEYWAPFAKGPGVVLSHDLLSCIVKRNHLETGNGNTQVPLIHIEDAYTGVLVQDCGGTCRREERMWADYLERLVSEGVRTHPDFTERHTQKRRYVTKLARQRATDYIVMHHVKTWEVMQMLHRETCCRSKSVGDPSCATILASSCTVSH